MSVCGSNYFCGCKERSGNGETEPVEKRSSLQSCCRAAGGDSSSSVERKALFMFLKEHFVHLSLYNARACETDSAALGWTGAARRGGGGSPQPVNGQNVLAAFLRTSTFGEIIAIKNGACVCSCGAARRITSREKASHCRVFTYFSSFTGSLQKSGDHFL